jgi:hypothetical protein
VKRRLFIAVSGLAAAGVAGYGVLVSVPAPASAEMRPASVVGGPITRSEVLARANTWAASPREYSQSVIDPSTGYRQDCSGYVSMALHLSTPGRSTVNLPDVMHVIGKEELRPGDLVMNGGPGTGGDAGHVMIFERWANGDHSRLVAYEQTPPRTMHHERSYPGSPYKAYRYNNITDDPTPQPDPEVLPAGSSAVHNANGNLEVYANHRGQIVENFWAPSGQWSGWRQLGMLSAPASGKPVAISNKANGNIEVYANAGGQIVENYWSAGNGQWSGWRQMGTLSAPATGTPAVVANRNGNIEVYANAGGQIVENYWSAGNGQWSGWRQMSSLAPAADQILAVVANPTNNNVQLYVEAGGQITENYWSASNGQWSGWHQLSVLN